MWVMLKFHTLRRKDSSHVRESTKVLDSGSQPLDSGSQHLDSGFQPFGFRIPTFWIPDSIPKWIPDSKPLWIPNSSLWIPDSNSKDLLDSGLSYMGRPDGRLKNVRTSSQCSPFHNQTDQWVQFTARASLESFSLFNQTDQSVLSQTLRTFLKSLNQTDHCQTSATFQISPALEFIQTSNRLTMQSSKMGNAQNFMNTGILAVVKQLKQLQRNLWNNSEASTGFEPMTSAIPVRCSTNWAMKPACWKQVGALAFFLCFLCNCEDLFH